MSYRLLAFDLDGTVLSEDLRLDPRDEAALHALRQRGVRLVACTGRPFPSALQWVDRLGLTDPFVCYQGAQVRQADGAVRFERGVDRELAAEVVFHCRDLGLEVHAYRDDRLLADEDRPEVRLYSEHSGMPVEFVPDLVPALGPTTPKLVSVADEATVARLLPEFGRRWRGRLTVATSLPRYLEMTAADADKGVALAVLAGELGVAAAEAVAVGDGLNDVTMLRWAGVGAAVEGGPPDLLAAAALRIGPPGSGGLATLVARLWGRNGSGLEPVTTG